MGNGNDEVGTDFCSVSDLLRRKKEVLQVITIKAKLITPVIPNIAYTIQLPKDNIYSRVTLRLLIVTCEVNNSSDTQYYLHHSVTQR